LVATISGVIAPDEAFSGLGHPATVTVAAVLVISRALTNTGVVEIATSLVKVAINKPAFHIAVLAGLGALLSTFMNNVGALALLMPVALQSSVEAKRSPAIVLMPLAFGTILGGMVTLIGTPPNIIVAAYRGEISGTPFNMFDFTPVGATVALVGLVFVTVIGWHLIPSARRKQKASQELFKIEDYVAEVRVPEGSKAIEMSLDELEAATEDSDALVVGLIRGERSILGAAWRERIQAGDILILESDQKGLDKFVGTLELELPSPQEKEKKARERQKSEQFHPGEGVLMEAVIPSERSWLIGRTPRSLKLRTRFGVNLLAASRQGQPHRGRLKSFRFQAGDVLLLQGEEDRLREVISRLGCLPLAERQLQFVKRNLALLSALVFGLAIASATLGFISLPIALVSAAILMVVLNIVTPREMYDTVDWPVVVLIGAMIPIGRALEASGVTNVVVEFLLSNASGFSPTVLLALLLILTMMLSDVLNNAATAVVMAPFGWTLAQHLGVNPDPYLMAVAIGASCAFLTPIGHQNNLLVMGPGGYQFGDYWRMGLPLEILIVAVSIPTLLWVWPL
jgi:di/tricarboxylate transporter